MNRSKHTERELIRYQRLNVSLFEKRMRDNNNNFFDIAEHINGIVHYNSSEDMKITQINTFGMKFVGISSEEALQMGHQFFSTFIHPKTIEKIFPKYINFINTSDDFNTHAEIELVKDYRRKEYHPLLNIVKLDKKNSGAISLTLPLRDLEKSVSKIFLTLYEVKDNLFVSNYEKYSRLTPRERSILKLVAGGLTSLQIANRLSISKFTVDTHRKNIVSKLETTNLSSLIKFAITFNPSS